MIKNPDMTVWQSMNYRTAKELLKKGNYKNEKHFCDLIESNLKLVCRKVFDSEYISHIREYSLPSIHNSKPTADFLVKTGNENILIECKTPQGRSQWGIQQLMKYIVITEANKLPIHRYVLFTTEFCSDDADIIKRFSLPIEVYFICNEKVITLTK